MHENTQQNLLSQKKSLSKNYSQKNIENPSKIIFFIGIHFNVGILQPSPFYCVYGSFSIFL